VEHVASQFMEQLSQRRGAFSTAGEPRTHRE
jgi:hypothetical protein